MSEMSIEQQASDSIDNPSPYQVLPANELPVGTILPAFFPDKIQLAEGWCLCLGQVITDKASPFLGRAVPRLGDSRFLMGVSSSDLYGKYGGTNTINGSGDHDHTYTIRKAGTRNRTPDGFQAEGDECKIVTLHTSSNGQHDHGGDNRPQWFGVLYMIRYK